MKKYFIYAVSALALAGCSSDDFLGGQPSPTKLTDNNVINFNGSSSATTRGVLNGTTNPTAASKLGENFVVYGYKTLSGTTPKTSVVYDHYNVNWAGPANHTESNTNGWEYVGYDPNVLSGLSGVKQTIKYWDYSATQYDFIAFSFGEATQVTTDPANANQVKASKVTIANNVNGYSGPTYTLTGAVKDLAKVYIADRVTAKKDVSQPSPNPLANRLVPYGKPIPFNFRSLGTKVRIGLYEIIPGYSVKDVKFYKNNSDKNGNNGANPCLYASGTTIPAGSGTMTVSFPTVAESNTDYNKAHVKWSVADGNSNVVSVLELEKYSLGNNNADQKEAQGDYLVRTSTAARNASYKTVLPAEVGALTLKVDYTLVSIDGSGETINVKGATAVVPEVYTKWEPNYAYTYIFKISDNTNGSTGGTSDPAGLYPITFDAIVTETEDGLSETITTVSEPSITTYAKGAVNDEYVHDSNVYVSVKAGSSNVILSLTDPDTNCALYTAVCDDGYNGGITESTVANCIANGTKDTSGTWTATATDAHSKTLTVKAVEAAANDHLNIVPEIDAKDAADGNAITGNFAKFTPTAGTYVFEYTDKDDPANPKKYYKVIKVN